MQKEECDKQLKLWVDDKKATIDQLISNVNQLRELVKKMKPTAFNDNCDKIISGVDFFADELPKIINSEDRKDLPSGEILIRLRSKCCSIINDGTDTWINLLGRLYSYMSVDQLREQLEMEGLSFELVSKAFTTMQAVMASMGIVVLNCSPGYDSGNNPITLSLFANDSAIDRVTNWLGGNEAVGKAIANHGRTVYDFGQLAYFTFDKLDIQKGSVIYYNS